MQNKKQTLVVVSRIPKMLIVTVLTLIALLALTLWGMAVVARFASVRFIVKNQPDTPVADVTNLEPKESFTWPDPYNIASFPLFQIKTPFGGMSASDGTMYVDSHRFMKVDYWPVATFTEDTQMHQALAAGDWLTAEDCLYGVRSSIDKGIEPQKFPDSIVNTTIRGQVFCVRMQSDGSMGGHRAIEKTYTTRIGDYYVSFAGASRWGDPGFTQACGIGPDENIDKAACAKLKAAVPGYQDMSWFDSVMQTFVPTAATEVSP